MTWSVSGPFHPQPEDRPGAFHRPAQTMTHHSQNGAIMPLSALIAAHGPWRVLFAALTTLVRQATGTAAPDVDSLPDRLRADIGLPPRGSPQVLPILPVRW